MSKETEEQLTARKFAVKAIHEDKLNLRNPSILAKLLKEYAQQSPATDEHIEKMAKKVFGVEFWKNIDTKKKEIIWANGAKWLRDLQPKTDNWVSVGRYKFSEKSGKWSSVSGTNEWDRLIKNKKMEGVEFEVILHPLPPTPKSDVKPSGEKR